MTSTVPKLGRLSLLGISSIRDVALYMPSNVSDFTAVCTSFDVANIVPNKTIVIRGRIACDPKSQWKNKRPMTQFTVTDGIFNVYFTLFGDARQLLTIYKKNREILVQGVTTFFGGKLYLNDASIIDVGCAGQLCPVYKGKSGKITAESTAKLIRANLQPSIPLAAKYLQECLLSILPDQMLLCRILNYSVDDISGLLESVHMPKSTMEFEASLTVVKKIAALLASQPLLTPRNHTATDPLFSASYPVLAQHVPFQLTQEQKQVVGNMVRQVQKGILLEKVLLVGDVGTGKTIVYGMLTAYFAHAGRRVAILLPNENLARQIGDELRQSFPWMRIGFVLGVSTQSHFTENVLIGTTALLFRKVGSFDLLICDEQHKLSREQREQLRGSRTHMLEVSATPIPRTMALAQFGALDIYQLRQCHVEKHIVTKIWDSADRRQMFNEIMKTVANGKRVLVVCPKKESTSKDATGLRSAQEVAEKFNAYCPGRVGLAHSGKSSEANQQAIDDIKSGKIQILVATSIVEVGLTIPELERVVIVHPERFGLQTLHQIRGRAVRAGGTGHCDLYIPKPLKNPDSYKRLEVLVKTTDGYEIAEHDMQLRGTGDLSKGSDKQHGTPDHIIQNVPISLKHIEWAVSIFEKVRCQSGS